MSDLENIRWFKNQFKTKMENILRGTPFSVDMLTAIAMQETGYIWGALRERLPFDEILKLCVGDTLDAPNRSAFPARKSDLLREPRGEIFNLKWFDVDFNRNLIQIRESKSGKKRFVPMNETVRQLFANLKRKSEYVFPSPKTGGRLDNIKRSFRRAVEEAGIEGFRFHDLRHTAATRMADGAGGADAFTLMRILGHSDIRMTMRYTHATDAALQRAVTNLDEKSDFGNELATKQKRQAQGAP